MNLEDSIRMARLEKRVQETEVLLDDLCEAVMVLVWDALKSAPPGSWTCAISTLKAIRDKLESRKRKSDGIKG